MKRRRARRVLGWVTAWETRVLLAYEVLFALFSDPVEIPLLEKLICRARLALTPHSPPGLDPKLTNKLTIERNSHLEFT